MYSCYFLKLFFKNNDMECHRFAYADLDCLILSSPSVKYEALYPAQPLLFSRTEPAPQVASEIVGGTMSTDEP